MPFKRIKYPDGQVSAKFEQGHPFSDPYELIKERINSYEDLFYVRAIAEVVGDHSLLGRGLFIPCLFGQRSDKRFDAHQSFDLKLIAEVINSCNFREVQILDPHSDVALALIDRSTKVSSFEYVQLAYIDILVKTQSTDGSNILLVAPDAGAYKKVFEFGEKLNLPVMGAMKHRDNAGNVDLMFTHNVEGKDCFIVDDLCDGGYTFLVLGRKLKGLKARSVYLYVSHGLFSKGFVELRKVIDHIYCTNSVRDLDMNYPIFSSLLSTPSEKITDLVESGKLKDYVTQYKVI